MKSLYLQCNMGIAGDMLMSALFGLVDNKKAVLDKINSIGFPYTEITFANEMQNGITGLVAKVNVDGEEENSSHHFSRNLGEVCDIINSLDVSDKIKDNVIRLYSSLADAESKVHGEPVDRVHFHEVGMLDAIADFTVCSFLLDELGIDTIFSSSVNVGSGTVKCAHGVLPVPAPATAVLLEGIPYYNSEIDGELCTPTGAAILKHYCSGFGKMPEMITENVSYGFGKKTFDGYCNCVRAFYGDLNLNKSVCELICNVDDMTAEEITFSISALMENGALDVSAQPLAMKKGRVGYEIHVVCKVDERKKFIELIYKYTSTIGIRENFCSRYLLEKNIKTIDTPYGQIRVKYSEGYNCKKSKIEYDDIAEIAKNHNLSFIETRRIVEKFL